MKSHLLLFMFMCTSILCAQSTNTQRTSSGANYSSFRLVMEHQTFVLLDVLLEDNYTAIVIGIQINNNKSGWFSFPDNISIFAKGIQYGVKGIYLGEEPWELNKPLRYGKKNKGKVIICALFFNRIPGGISTINYREPNFIYWQNIPLPSNPVREASATGIVVSTNGVIATNYHVVENSTQVSVTIKRNGEAQTYASKVIMTDPKNDLALIRIEDNNFKSYPNIPYAIKTGVSDVGTDVFAMGYPETYILGDEIKVTNGIINSQTGKQGDITTYQHSVPIYPGNSGGPLFDEKGYLVGITNSGFVGTSVNYAIKSSYLRNLMELANISLPLSSSISNLSREEKIKILKEYVVFITVK